MYFSRDKLAAGKRIGTHLIKDFGDGFDMSVATDSAIEYEVQVHRCFYVDFFRAENAEHLTHLFCALDRSLFNIFRTVDYKVRFTLEGALASGDSACRFCLKTCAKSGEALL